MVVAQLELGFKTPPRKRPKKRGPKKTSDRVAHETREFDRRLPLHVTMRLRPEVWNLRSRRCYRILEGAFYRCLERRVGRIAHYSVQGNHIHMIVEADDRSALARMVQSFCIRSAKGLNKVMKRPKGTVFGDRFHSRLLTTPTQTRKTIVYVLQNGRKHLSELGRSLPDDWIDTDYSSAPYFTGWVDPSPPPSDPAPIATPTTWLLTAGWMRGGGRILRCEVPANRPRRTRT